MTANSSAATQKDHIVATVGMGLHQTMMERTASVCEQLACMGTRLCAIITSLVVNHVQTLTSVVV